MSLRDMELRFGYTAHDLDRAARIAIHGTGRLATGPAERLEVARAAIAEALYEATEWPSWTTLIFAGRDAIWKWLHHERRMVGKAPASKGGGRMRRFDRYWMYPMVQASHEAKVVERLAVEQAMALLSDRHREALLALSEHGSMREAARCLGIPHRTFSQRASQAREIVQSALLGGETPVKKLIKPRRPDSTLRPCGTPAAYLRHRKRGESQDQDCIDAWRQYRVERAAARGEARYW